ncbi:MAG: redoxin domain-containing protein [Candidatus Hydrogenedentes bacterium]|nr:redoxin domain-containing protein [Candidatus Hydrogenedentota bacterium]
MKKKIDRRVGVAKVRLLGLMAAIGLGFLVGVLFARIEWRSVTNRDARPLPTVAEGFRLTDHLGRSHELSRYQDAKAVVLFFAGNGCPIVRQSVPLLKELRDRYSPKGVVFLMIDSVLQDTLDDVVKESEEFKIDLPVLLDTTQLVARTLGVQRTAETLIILPNAWRIVYRGPLDDRFDYGATKPIASKRWLEAALTAVLEGKPVSESSGPVKGCLIDFKKLPEHVSYARQVAPIIAQKCAPCHTEGNVAPFAFDGYESVRSRAGMIREVLMTRRMPPWHADPHYGSFANDRSLSDDEMLVVTSWLEVGARRDAGADPLESYSGPSLTWTLGEPDQVVALPAVQEISAAGVFPYRYVRMPLNLSEDKWVRAVEVRPTNRKVLHHCLIFVRYPSRLRHLQPDYDRGLDGYFAGYVPGAMPTPFPENTGKFLPKDGLLVFQLHYNATGKDETDRTELGLYFHEQRPPQELSTRAAAMTELRIPPGASDYETMAVHRLDHDALLWDMSPHMHYRGSRFQYEARYPDGRTEILLSVPGYNFNWQTAYRLKEPKRLPAGTEIVCRGAFDNSARNPANPDPTAWVEFGEQTFEEMFIGYLNYSIPVDATQTLAAVREDS